MSHCFWWMITMLCLPLFAAVPRPDPLVRKQLAVHRLNFNLSSSNNFEIIIKTYAGPEVMVTVESAQLTVMKSAWRHIYASIPLRATVSPELRKRLMESSIRSRVGAWEIAPDGRSVSFVCKVPVNLSDNHFYAVLEEVSETTAGMSLVLNGKTASRKKNPPSRKKKP